MTDNARFLDQLASAFHQLSARDDGTTDWLSAPGYVWQEGVARPVAALKAPPLALLRGIDQQKDDVVANVRRHAEGHAAHDMLLWGARGMGKSALLRSAIVAAQAIAPAQLALVQLSSDSLVSLPRLMSALRAVPRRFFLYIDDLGFEDGDGDGPRKLRSLLEGGIEARPDNVRLAVTSNRRAIVARHLSEQDDPINVRDVVDDRLALSDRFGLYVGFHNCSQDEYLAIIQGYAEAYDLVFDAQDALTWATQRGARSGRIAWHYVTEIAGRAGRRLPS
jgi:uncharacterized protein